MTGYDLTGASAPRTPAATAKLYIGTHEDYPYANRGITVDRFNALAGAVVGAPWCASFAGAMLRAAGCAVPKDGYAACESWHRYGAGLRQDKPTASDLILYNFQGGTIAHHIGIIYEVLPDRLLVIEGNTSLILNDREGYGVFMKQRDWASDRDDGITTTSLNQNYLLSQLQRQGILGWVTPYPQASKEASHPL